MPCVCWCASVTPGFLVRMVSHVDLCAIAPHGWLHIAHSAKPALPRRCAPAACQCRGRRGSRRHSVQLAGEAGSDVMLFSLVGCVLGSWGWAWPPAMRAQHAVLCRARGERAGVRPRGAVHARVRPRCAQARARTSAAPGHLLAAGGRGICVWALGMGRCAPHQDGAGRVGWGVYEYARIGDGSRLKH